MPSSGLRSLVFLALCCPVAAAAAGHEAAPTVFCIANSTQLKAAFVQMAADADAGNTPARYQLQIQKGSYFPPILGMVGTLDAPISSVELLGGYDAGCTTRTIDPANTLLNIGSTGSAPQLGFTTRGDILVEGLSLISAYPSAQTSVNDVLALRQAPGSLRRQHWSIRQTIFQGKAAQGDANPDNGALNAIVGAVDTPPVSLAVENVVAKGFGDGDCVFQYRELPLAIPLAGHELVFAHSTIAYNGTCAIGAEGLDAHSRVVLTNNIAAGNSGVSVATSGDPDSVVELHNNVFTSGKSIGTNLAIERGILTADPSLVAYSNFRLSSGSVAINSGTTFLPSGIPMQDVSGASRWKGSRPDRGAHESVVDDTTHYVVTNSDDSGLGSLREAIETANSELGPARIEFNILQNGVTQCPAVILVKSDMSIWGDTIIDGFTQPGSSPNTIEDGDNATRCVLVNGEQSTLRGFISYGGSASKLLAVKGVEFGGFAEAGIRAGGPDEFVSHGNRFGGTRPDVVDWVRENLYGISVEGDKDGFNGTDFASIGSLADVGARNVFESNTFPFAIDHARVVVLSNSILPPTLSSIRLEDLFGGSAAVSNDLKVSVRVAATDGFGDASSLSFERNRFLKSNWSLLEIENREGPQGVERMRIEENDLGAWTWLHGWSQSGAPPFGVTYARNRTFAAGIAFGLESDREYPKPNDNDAMPSQIVRPANDGLNYPVLDAASGSVEEGIVTGVLETRSGKYAIEIFANASCDASGHGDGEELIGIGTVSVQDSGTANGVSPFQIAVKSQQSLSGRSITATATDEKGNTSEFSECLVYTGPPAEIFRDGFE